MSQMLKTSKTANREAVSTFTWNVIGKDMRPLHADAHRIKNMENSWLRKRHDFEPRGRGTAQGKPTVAGSEIRWRFSTILRRGKYLQPRLVVRDASPFGMMNTIAAGGRTPGHLHHNKRSEQGFRERTGELCRWRRGTKTMTSDSGAHTAFLLVMCLRQGFRTFAPPLKLSHNSWSGMNAIWGCFCDLRMNCATLSTAKTLWPARAATFPRRDRQADDPALCAWAKCSGTGNMISCAMRWRVARAMLSP